MTQDKEIAQNVVQDIFIDLWEKRKQVQINNIEKYLFGAVKFQVFNHYRNKKLNKEVLQDQFDDYILENKETINHSRLDKLEELLNKLPEKRGRIVRMNKLQNLSIAEVANELNLSQQTVKNQLHLAFKQLKAGLL